MKVNVRGPALFGDEVDDAPLTESGGGVFADLPARKLQDGRMALKGPRDRFGSLDTKPGSIIFNCRDGCLGDSGPSRQFILAESRQLSDVSN